MVGNSIQMVCSFPSSSTTNDFDTFVSFLDWMVAGGTISGNQSVASFEQILTNATQIDTG